MIKALDRKRIPFPEPKAQRSAVTYSITPQLIALLLKSGNKLISVKGMPADAKIYSVKLNPNKPVFDFTVVSEEFKVKPPGALLKKYDLDIKIVDLPSELPLKVVLDQVKKEPGC